MKIQIFIKMKDGLILDVSCDRLDIKIDEVLICKHLSIGHIEQEMYKVANLADTSKTDPFNEGKAFMAQQINGLVERIERGLL